MAVKIRQVTACRSTKETCAHTDGLPMNARNCVKLVKTAGNGGGGGYLAVFREEFHNCPGLTLDFIPFLYLATFIIHYFYEFGLKIIIHSILHN